MAYVKIWASRKYVNKTLDYVKDERKTNLIKPVNDSIDYIKNEHKTSYSEHNLITGINCSVENTAEEFMNTIKYFGKQDTKILVHHGVQSFSPEENISPEMAHEIGKAFLREYLEDNFQVLLTTHVDKEHIHNHFVICSVSYKTGKKYYGNKTTLKKAREISDMICLDNKLSTIKSCNKGLKTGRYQGLQNNRQSLRKLIKIDIDRAIASSTNLDEFFSYMENIGYKMGSMKRKHFAIHPPGFKNSNGNDGYIRLRSLNDPLYELQGIKHRLLTKNNLYNLNHSRKVYQGKRAFKSNYRRKPPKYLALKYKMLYDLGVLKRKPNKFAYANLKRTRMELENIVCGANLISKYRLETENDVINLKNQLLESKRTLETERRRLYRLKGEEREKSEPLISSLSDEIRELNSKLRGIDTIRVKRNTGEKNSKAYEDKVINMSSQKIELKQ